MPKIKRTYAAPQAKFSMQPQEGDVPIRGEGLAVAAPNRRSTDYDVDKLVFWVCVCLFAFAFAVVK
jgi:hypothetical protein